ncbi:MAG: amino acid dehydrogenase [Alphaproteobacteria bacterium]|nr:amino acid dehydrogenase [Alphaproteobacteria bacterium]
MKLYRRPVDGLADALRLASAMSAKWAIVDIPRGGGKGVLALSRPLLGNERAGLLHRYGQLVGRLQGEFTTGIDLGTTAGDLRVVAEETDHVHSFFRDYPYREELGMYTACGVVSALDAVLRHWAGSPQFAGLTAMIQGLGGVGAPLARMLATAGVRLRVTDSDDARARHLASSVNACVLDPEAVFDSEAEVFMPCADGGILNDQTIGRLRVKAVVGAANNQLFDAPAVRRLHRRGILFAPDFLANAGAAIAVDSADRGLPEARVGERIDVIGRKLTGILAEASERDEPPIFAARRQVAAAFGR